MARSNKPTTPSASAPSAPPAETPSAPPTEPTTPSPEVPDGVTTSPDTPPSLNEESEVSEKAEITPERRNSNAGNAAFTGVVARLEKAPVGAKIIVNEGIAHYADQMGAEEIPANDPARRMLPAGAWLRRVGPKEFSGFIPGGARRSTTDSFSVTHSTAQRVMHDMVASL